MFSEVIGPVNKDIDYITILEESLEKKIKTLDRLIELNKMQYDSVQGETIDDELFNESISEKEKCIDSIQELDKGFEMVYEHVREELMNNKDAYVDKIDGLKKLISEITEKSMEVQLGEKRNEQAVMKALNNERKNIKQTKVTTRAAADYYKSMNKMNYVDPQFLDKKN